MRKGGWGWPGTARMGRGGGVRDRKGECGFSYLPARQVCVCVLYRRQLFNSFYTVYVYSTMPRYM